MIRPELASMLGTAGSLAASSGASPEEIARAAGVITPAAPAQLKVWAGAPCDGHRLELDELRARVLGLVADVAELWRHLRGGSEDGPG